MSDVITWADLDEKLCVLKILSISPIGKNVSRVYCPGLQNAAMGRQAQCTFDKVILEEKQSGWCRSKACLNSHGKVCMRLKPLDRL